MVISGRIQVTTPGGMAHFRRLGVGLDMGTAKRQIKREFISQLAAGKTLTFEESKSERGHWRAYLDGVETNYVILEVRL